VRSKIEQIETLDDFASFIAIFALDAARGYMKDLLEQHELTIQSWVEIVIFVLFAADLVSYNFIQERLPGQRGIFWNLVIDEIRVITQFEAPALRYFDDILDHRFEEYFQALHVEHELGPMWNIGKVATKNIFNEKEKNDAFLITSVSFRFGFFTKQFESYFLEPELFIW